MLSNKVKDFLRKQGWWYEDASEEYKGALLALEVDLESEFAEFYLHAEDGPTFHYRSYEIYQVCWFSINSNYKLDIKRTHEYLGLPEDYIPLDSFQGECGFFYNRRTGEVLELSLGLSMKDFIEGRLKPQWKEFNSFIEWFFELSD